MGNALEFGHREFEDAEGLNLPYAEMNRKGGGWHEPAIVACAGDRVFTVKYREHGDNAF